MTIILNNIEAVEQALFEEYKKAQKVTKKADKALNSAANGDEGAKPYAVAYALYRLAKKQEDAAYSAWLDAQAERYAKK